MALMEIKGYVFIFLCTEKSAYCMGNIVCGKRKDITDIHMTGIDGFTVLEAMSQRGMLEEIPVIMISSEDNVDTVRRAFDLGASDYISRPFDARVVYQRITNTIRMYAKQRRCLLYTSPSPRD